VTQSSQPKKKNGRQATAKVDPTEEVRAVEAELVIEEAPIVSEIEVLQAEVLPEVAELEGEESIPVPLESEPISRGSEVVPYDALTAYLREVQRYRRLSREEERDLAIKYSKSKDMQAAYKLISSNLWLVVKLARDYEKAARNLLDLIQEGNIGLMEAVKNFDPYRGVRFPSYAVWWIKAYIIRFVIANWRLVKIGTTQAQRKLFFNLKKEKDRLEQEGFHPEPKLIAERLNVTEGEVVEMEQRLSGADVSVDAPLDAEGENTLLSVLPSSASSAEDILASKQMRQMVLEGMKDFEETINPKERIIFRERMLGEEKVTLDELSQKLEVSRERIRQIEVRIREKLKLFMEKRLGSAITDI